MRKKIERKLKRGYEKIKFLKRHIRRSLYKIKAIYMPPFSTGRKP